MVRARGYFCYREHVRGFPLIPGWYTLITIKRYLILKSKTTRPHDLWETSRERAKENRRVPGTVHQLRKRQAAVDHKESGSLLTFQKERACRACRRKCSPLRQKEEPAENNSRSPQSPKKQEYD